METKRKSEKIIFWGFIFLTISFIAMVYYFQQQTEKLASKGIELENKEIELNIKEVQLEVRNKQIVKLENLVPLDNKTQLDSISKQADKSINTQIKKISKIYIQVGTSETKSKLVNINFISKLNSKGYNVIDAYDSEDENNTDNTIRYFNEDDKKLAEELRADITNEFSITLKPILIKSFKVNKGQLEIWIK